ncbi:hypothetical protein NQ315_006547 [Exocentrus adspersus]|uniref:GRIP domain-containing protein n=1 Tax=Exocentrus adspersus TaxID=1586481 RepID=A0AAV8W1R1_9CUCU|nr:hypothetical protein NQ315_006547 [Exocentrus adspersus]
MSWLNFNDSLNNLKGQITNFASNVLADDEGAEEISADYEELRKRCVQQEAQIAELKRTLENAEHIRKNGKEGNNHSEETWNWNVSHQQDNTEIVSKLQKQVTDLQKEKCDLIGQLEQLDSENQQNLSKVIGMKDKLQDENNDLQDEVDKLKNELVEVKKSDHYREKYEMLLQSNRKLKSEHEESLKELSVLKSSNETFRKVLDSTKTDEDNNKSVYAELEKAKEDVKRYKKKSSEDTETCQRLASVLETYEKQVTKLEQELSSLRTEVELLKSSNEDLRRNNSELESGKNQESVLLELHNKYINIITENIKKFQDCDKPSDFQHCSYEDSPHIAEFSKQVENILRILLDFKCKCEVLEQQMYELSEEKTKIVTEKNHEIEKLIQNSEILSQEVITKSQTLKEYENECNELAKNNEILINELESYKNQSGLQTISESNEDNIILLESQLENANKRIEDLEKVIDDLEHQHKSENLDDALQQLTIQESDEIASKQNDYQELLNSFDQLQIEYEALKSDLASTKEDFKSATEENDTLKTNIEKLKAEYENTEYQLSEVNVNVDSLHEELDACKTKLEVLLGENTKLRMINEESSKAYEDIKSELNTLKDKYIEAENSRKQFEVQVRALTEKLQNAKMSETSLKLQYDTVNKEVMALSEVKHNLETSLQATTTELKRFETSYIELQTANSKLVQDYEELKEIHAKKEEQIRNFETLVSDLQTKLQKFEQLAVDENEDLLKKLTLDDDAKVIDDLKTRLAKYESLAMEESQQLFKNLSVTDTVTNKMEVDVLQSTSQLEALRQQYDALLCDRDNLQTELNQLKEVVEQHQRQLQEVTNSRNELIALVTTKHQENVAYHNEIQRLSQILNAEAQKCQSLEAELKKPDGEKEKLLDQNNFLKEKCEVMAKNLLEEQSKVQQLLQPSEKELTLQKKVDRLQAHLIELEEHYTQELLQAEQKNAELQGRVSELEEREKSSSTMYTSVSIRANQQVEALQNQLQAVVNERDSLRGRISDAEDLNSKQAAALTNLQFVLEQFQKDKERDVAKETERIKRQIKVEKQVQEDLKREIAGLKSQLEESKQGLQAASRLSDQLEHSKKAVGALKEEVSQLQDKLAKSEENLKKATSQTDGKVDKSLIKNLIIGFVCSNNINLNKDQRQILKIIATVLDFNQQDHDKVKLNAPQQGSWLGSFLFPQPSNQSMTQESLSQAFIKFLENESKPRVVPSLLSAATTEAKSETESKSTTPRQTPIILNEIVLPTFTDFPQSRNSSSILKDVLKNNNT